jgi:hypothetical protein
MTDLVKQMAAGRKGVVEGPEGMKTIDAIDIIYNNA